MTASPHNRHCRRVVEQGTHEELMERCGAYAKLYNLQFRANEGNLSSSDLVGIQQ